LSKRFFAEVRARLIGVNTAAPASFKRMVMRALLRRCPRCGGKGWFRGWFHRLERCRSCGFKYERQVGFMLGAMTINIIVTFGCLAAVLVIGSIVTYPDVPVLPLVVLSIAIGVIVPLAFYPFSYTLWAAIELKMKPLDSTETADAAAAVAGSARNP
jgi:uncharacterized protein (DUF983 family)